jgi:hypothetical protein
LWINEAMADFLVLKALAHIYPDWTIVESLINYL